MNSTPKTSTDTAGIEFSERPRHGETNWADNPELYELKIQLMEHVLGMSTATPTWRRDLVNRVRSMQSELVALRRFHREVKRLAEEQCA